MPTRGVWPKTLKQQVQCLYVISLQLDVMFIGIPVWDAMSTTSSQFSKCGAENGGNGSQGVAAAAHNLQDTLDHSTDAANSNQETSERRARVKDLFFAMDKDGNGKLDVGEFRGQFCHTHLMPSHATTTAAGRPGPRPNSQCQPVVCC